MSLTRKVAYNTVIQVVGKIITTFISLFLVAVLTRYLGVAGYGQYTTIFAYVGFAAVFADFGFFWILVREIANPKADIDKATSNVLTLRLFIGTIVFAIASIIALFIPQYHDFRIGIAIVAFASLWLALNSTYVGVFQNKLRMDKAVITDILGRVIIVGIIYVLIQKGAGLNLFLWAFVIGNFLNFVVSAYLGRIYVRFRLVFDFSYWKKVFWRALPMGIVLILGLVYFKIDTVMLSLMRSSEDVGIYGPPYKVLELLMFFPAIFMGNVFPIVTRYLYENDSRVHHALQRSFDFLVIVAVPIVLGVIFTSARIIKLVAGQEFVTAHTIEPVWGLPATSSTALQILVIAVGISFISQMFGYVVIALGKQAKLIGPYLILVIFNIGMNLILIPKISYIGAAVITVLTEALVLFFSWWVAHKYLEIKLHLGIIWRVLVAGAVLGIFLFFCAQYIHLLILIPLSAILYAAVLYLVGGINKDMFLSLVRKE
ncbi:hypothetical protein A2V71_03485 [Candidatus Berkelbacteria bacterium RBG_13_40_8]|uniref:Uncharacterized protein n=1 Tax=Candidatus Berkelbacteria bacterium RBG_13_40_8 TaxID=1797467 RepID=A0A1F5DNF9_9BACT|nr:MAG: hypothetical protein A2V71_03485 [Candidatus Berkelbacteria bacterium RBG_13_40_8]